MDKLSERIFMQIQNVFAGEWKIENYEINGEWKEF